MAAPYFIGIDVGTQGGRVVLIDSSGNIIGSQEEIFPLDDQFREEQSPTLWWEVCLRLLKLLISEAVSEISLSDLKAMSVTSTSGTVIPLDQKMQPLHNAIMYSDKRSTAEGKICRALASKYHPAGYTGFNSSSGLSKMLWFVRNFPEKVPHIAKWIHACDFLIGKLTDRWGISDCTNALKSGYDVRDGDWPSYLYQQLPLKKEWFPEVVTSGTPIANISPQMAHALGLSQSVIIVAGMTDGCASQIASGAVKLGDWNTTIGTTLVVKGVTENEMKDPEERLYNHRHPEGYWMPGGASNIGADWIAMEFSEELTSLNEKVKLKYVGLSCTYKDALTAIL